MSQSLHSITASPVPFILTTDKVVPFSEVINRGAKDVFVCAAAQVNDAVLVAFDRDMKRIARGHERFRTLNLIQFTCPEPIAAKLLAFAMSFIEHEWAVENESSARRLHVEISTHVLRSFR